GLRVLRIRGKQKVRVKRRTMFDFRQGLVFLQRLRQRHAVELFLSQLSAIFLRKCFGLPPRFAEIGLDPWIIRPGVEFSQIPLNALGFESGCVHKSSLKMRYVVRNGRYQSHASSITFYVSRL